MDECIGLSLLFLTSVASEDDLPFRHAHPALVQVFLRLPPQNAITLCFDEEKKKGRERRAASEQTIRNIIKNVTCSQKNYAPPPLSPSLPAPPHTPVARAGWKRLLVFGHCLPTGNPTPRTGGHDGLSGPGG